MIILSADITNFISWFFNQCKNIILFCFNSMKNITFNGFSLFDFVITIFIILIIFEVFISHPNNIRHVSLKGGKDKNENKND